MLSATNLLRPALALLAAQAAPVAAPLAALWATLGELRAHLLGLLAPEGKANDSVRTHALKFAETLVLAFTPGPADAGEPWSVALLADDAHPLLKRAELAAAAEETLQLLLGRLRGALTATLALVLVNSLALSLGRQRPQLLPRIAPALCDLQQRISAGQVEGLQRVQLASVQQALRSAVLTLLRQPAVNEAPAVEAALLHASVGLGGADEPRSSSAARAASCPRPTPSPPPPRPPRRRRRRRRRRGRARR